MYVRETFQSQQACGPGVTWSYMYWDFQKAVHKILYPQNCEEKLNCVDKETSLDCVDNCYKRKGGRKTICRNICIYFFFMRQS